MNEQQLRTISREIEDLRPEPREFDCREAPHPRVAPVNSTVFPFMLQSAAAS